MNRSATINVRINPKLKQEAQQVLDDIGLSSSKVIELLFRQIAIQGAVPFPVVSERYKGLPMIRRMANQTSLEVLDDVNAEKNLSTAKDSDDLAAQLNA